VGAYTPVTGAGSGGRRTIAWGGRSGACHQAVSDGGGEGRGGASACLGGVRTRSGGARARGRARKRGRDGWGCGGDRAGRARNIGRDLEEEEVRFLLLEVRNCLSRGRVPVGREPDGLFPCSQGDANRASPRTGQGAEGRCVHPNPVALVKGAAGWSERGGNGERELARCG
jgi:hypothetical protein